MKATGYTTVRPVIALPLTLMFFLSLLLSSCYTGQGMGLAKKSALRKSYETLVKERDMLMEENRQLKYDNMLLSKALKEQTIEEDIPAED